MDPETQALITAIAAAIGAVAIAYNTWQTSQLAKKAEENRQALQQVVLHTNSMKDELVREVRDSSLAKGAKDQRDLQQGQVVGGLQAPIGTVPVVIEEIPVPVDTPKPSAKRRPLGRKRA